MYISSASLLEEPPRRTESREVAAGGGRQREISDCGCFQNQQQEEANTKDHSTETDPNVQTQLTRGRGAAEGRAGEAQVRAAMRRNKRARWEEYRELGRVNEAGAEGKCGREAPAGEEHRNTRRQEGNRAERENEKEKNKLQTHETQIK